MDQIDESKILAELKLEKSGYILVSAHREENLDIEENLLNLIDTLNSVAEEFKLPFLGKIPIDLDMVSSADEGNPYISKYKKRRANDYLEELGLKERDKNKQKLQDYFVKVELLLIHSENQDNVDEAIELLNKIIELNPSSTEAYSRLGDIYFYHKESIDTAINFYKKAIELEHNHLNAHAGLARCYQGLNKEELAKKEWQKVIEIDPKHEQAREYLSK